MLFSAPFLPNMTENNNIENHKEIQKNISTNSGNYDKAFLKSLVQSFHAEAPEARQDQNQNTRTRKNKQLVYTKRRAINLKNFNQEIYAKQDVGHFMEKSTIRFEDREIKSLSTLIYDLLSDMFRNDKHMDEEKLNLIKDSMFSRTADASDHHGHAGYGQEHDGNKKNDICTNEDVSLIADTLQGYETEQSITTKTGSFKQNWLCIMACSKFIKKTQRVGITKLSHPINLGETCNSVRLLFLVLVPERHSPLHSPMEVAKTFGTVLQSNNFIASLMKINSENEFKNLLNIEVYKRDRIDRKKGHDELEAHNHHEHKHRSTYGEIFSIDKYVARKNSKVSVTGEKDDYDYDYDETENQEKMAKHNPHPADNFNPYHPGKGILIDISNRLPYYASDWYDALFKKTPTGSLKLRKWDDLKRILRSILFVFLSILLPTLAFGVANSFNTVNKINVERTVFGQLIAGIFFSIFSSQPLGLLMTTPPITLLIKFVHKLAYKELGVDFYEFYAMTGVFIGCNLILFSLINGSRFLKKITPSIEEIFAIFTAFAFLNEVIQQCIEMSDLWYVDPYVRYTELTNNQTTVSGISSDIITITESRVQPGSGSIPSVTFEYGVPVDKISCSRERVFLWLILMLGTFFVAFLTFSSFRRTPYLNQDIRNFLSDYSLFISVSIFTIIYNSSTSAVSFYPYILEYTDIFNGIEISRTSTHSDFKTDFVHLLRIENIWNLSSRVIAIAWAISIPLSVLFFLDQGFCSIVTNGAKNKLQKPGGYHLDLFLVGLVNIFMSLLGLPWLHLALPHSDFHVRGLAKLDQKISDGVVREQIRDKTVIEQRVTAFLGHLLMGLALIPEVFHRAIAKIPLPVTNGVFLFLGVTSLYDNQVLERALLLLTETEAYQNTSYLKKVPKKKIHLMTFFSAVQLGILIATGFYLGSYTKLSFPFIVVLMIPFRVYILPIFINHKPDGIRNENTPFIDILDGHH